MDFKIEPCFDQENNTLSVTVEGEIDIFNSTGFKDYLSNLVQEHACDIFIDCTNLEYVDSTGLGALVAVLKKVKQNGHNIHLLGLRPNILKLFRITNLDKVFVIEGDKYDN